MSVRWTPLRAAYVAASSKDISKRDGPLITERLAVPWPDRNLAQGLPQLGPPPRCPRRFSALSRFSYPSISPPPNDQTEATFCSGSRWPSVPLRVGERSRHLSRRLFGRQNVWASLQAGPSPHNAAVQRKSNGQETEQQMALFPLFFPSPLIFPVLLHLVLFYSTSLYFIPLPSVLFCCWGGVHGGWMACTVAQSHRGFRI